MKKLMRLVLSALCLVLGASGAFGESVDYWYLTNKQTVDATRITTGGGVGGVKVTPVIGDLPPSSDSVDDAASPLILGGKDGVLLVVQQTIPGLCYGLLRGETPDKVDALVDWHWAESETMTLRDFNPPKDGTFYRIVVGVEEF